MSDNPTKLVWDGSWDSHRDNNEIGGEAISKIAKKKAARCSLTARQGKRERDAGIFFLSEKKETTKSALPIERVRVTAYCCCQ